MKRQIGLNSWRTHIKTGFWFHEHLNMANEQVNVSQGFDVIWIWFCLYQYQEITSFISFYSWGTEFLLKYFQSLPGRLINAILKDSLLENSTKELHFHKKMKNESEDPYETYNWVSVYRDAESPSEARRPGSVQLLLGMVHHAHPSRNQGEPEWLLLHLFEKLKTVWHPEVIDWMDRPGSPGGRLPKHAENRCHLPQAHQRCRQWPRHRWQQQSEGTLLPRLAAFSEASKPRILHSGLGRKKWERNWFVKSNQWLEGLKTFEILHLKLN